VLDRDEAIKRIRAALKRRSGKAWSVTGDRGTAWGWIKIDAPPARRTWRHVQTKTPERPSPTAVYAGVDCVTPRQWLYPYAAEPILRPEDDAWATEALEAGRSVVYNWLVCDPTKEFGYTSPAEQLELGQLLGLGRPAHQQGESVPPEAREFYVARAEGREATSDGTCGEPITCPDDLIRPCILQAGHTGYHDAGVK
jgi:hypothetical protein